MVNIRTEVIREQAELLGRTAQHYDYWYPELEKCAAWIRQQEMKEKEEIHWILKKQCEEAAKQRRELKLMAEALRRICDKYEKTEQSIVNSMEPDYKKMGHIETVQLKQLRSQLSELGLHRME